MNKELVINSKIENISLVENLVDEISIELSLLADVYGNVLIALIEGVTNGIMHGNKNNENLKVKVHAFVDDKKLVFKIEDEGKGFAFDDLPDPTKPDNVEKPDGRGVFLMRHLADEIAFDNNGAIVFLKFMI